jgi:hypothetical protein
MFQTGDDTIPLPAGGVTRYFICGVQGHCNSGMKLAIKVDQGRRCRSRRIGSRRGPVTCSAASSAGGVASLAVGLSLAAARSHGHILGGKISPNCLLFYM